jgi:hypothetical protein
MAVGNGNTCIKRSLYGRAALYSDRFAKTSCIWNTVYRSQADPRKEYESLATMQGSAIGSNIRYYTMRKHPPLKERTEQDFYNAVQTARCLQLGHESLRLLIADQ